MKSIEQRTTEQRIDEEIARRTPTMYIYHVTGISRRTEGVTVHITTRSDTTVS